MKRVVFILAWAVLVPVSLRAANAAVRSVITAEQIAATLNRGGLTVSVDQLTLLTNAVANTANPELTVKSIERLDDRRAAVRLECASQQQCLPFMVTVRFDRDPIELPQPAIRNLPKAIIVRDGSRTTLHLDGAHVHITLNVICLENGSVGQTIKATSIDRHTNFRVRVTDNGMLEGAL